ncbi:hypothetical protein EST38_g2224 [Candolleomyces aberdarensis]|uniref:AMP-dependent synthetase/ligase domain-containing protein n=1 Tax=Candolleomyces aberdarensis TaxID=2316362 RepID=A0A4V1Q4X6_9AGAR|nr:hypothetical protein EST38_g2224 [Candolleomyces aberdarensis]
MASSQPKIYKSLLPPVPVQRSSIFTFLFEQTYYEHAPTAPAFIDFKTGQQITREAVKNLSLRLGWGLRNTIQLPGSSPGHPDTHLTRGDIVMFVSPNSLSWPLALFGCVAAGLKITLAAYSSRPRELSWQYLDIKPKAIFVARHLVPIVEQMFSLIGSSPEEARRRIWIMDTLSDVALSEAPDANGTISIEDGINGVNGLHRLVGKKALEKEEMFDGNDAEESVYICYSSGTTGRPKGVETTHKNIGTVLLTTETLWKGCETDQDVYIAMLPAYHMFGLAVLIHYPFMRGKPVVMLNQGFESKTFCEAVQRYRVTTVCLVPPIILELSTHPAVDQYDLSSITNLTSGAAPLSIALANKCLDRLATRGAKAILIQGCGSTETTCSAQIVAPAESVRKFGSVGQLVPTMEARLMVEVESQPGSEGKVYRDAEEGEEGEMWMRGPTVCKGYFNNPEANASTFTPDGWYKSGDILRCDEDGYFYIVDRKKEMLKYKGHQIAPAELEAILLEHPDVGDVGVIGIKDEYSGDELPRYVCLVVPFSPELIIL